jgi:transforming growth factor-beta-induced protein
MPFNRRTLLLTSAAAAATGLLAACGGGDDEPTAAAQQTIVEIAQANAQFSTLVAAVVKADLAGALSGTDLLTVFAPTNAAFDAAATALGLTDGSALVDVLPAGALVSVLTYHVVAGRNLSTGLSAGNLNTLYSFDGAPATLSLSLTSGVQLTDAVLTQATVTQPDISASNGVVHVIDKLLVPPGVLNIVQMAQLNPAFSQLVTAVVTAGLADALSAAVPKLTVFAPTNAAFSAIATTVAGLNNSELGNVLRHHVVGAEVLSTSIPFGTPVDTITLPANAPQQITINSATAPTIATITDASGSSPASNIVAVDVRASNGVIHVIDKVLIPVLAPR